MNTRHIVLAAGAALALSGLATSAFASGTASATANASVTVLSPTTITKTQDLVFGTVIRPTTTNTTIAMDANGNVTATGGNGSIVSSTTSAAKFNITVQAATTYTLASTLSFAQAGLINVAPGAPAATTGAVGTIAAAGTQEIRYGGQFDVTPATTAQAYTGTLSVTVTYN
jgi:succinate dehydrogenase/fumarate reductase flavoprotein subunit